MSSKVQRESCAADATPKKPTRPLTAYHLFFQLEREYILQTTPDDKDQGARTSTTRDDRPIGKQIDDGMPFRYRYIHLSPHWYASGSGKRDSNGKNKAKRKHRKTHGKISFLDLSKCISSRWAQLEERDGATKAYVHRIAARELDVYKGEMKLFKSCNASVVTKSQICLASCSRNSCTTGSVAAKSEYIMSLKNGKTYDSESYASVHKTFIGIEKGTKLQPKSRSSIQSISDIPGAERRLGEKEPFGDDSQLEFSFHPVPSSYWKKHKNKTHRDTGRDSSSRISGVNKMSSPSSKVPSRSSFGLGANAPYSFGGGRFERRKSWLPRKSNENGDDARDGVSLKCSSLESINAGRQDYNSVRMDLENEMASFMTRMGQDRSGERGSDHGFQPVGLADEKSKAVEITSDDAIGLMKALSDEDE